MGSNRYKGTSPRGTIPDYTPRESKKAVEEPTVALLPCCVCKKTITDGYYGRHGDGGTCNKTCETAYKPVEVEREASFVTAFAGSIFRR